MLNIQIRVAANQAKREIASVGTAIKAAQQAANAGAAGGMGPMATMANRFGVTNAAATRFAGTVDKMGGVAAKAFRAFPTWNKHMESMGKNMQWVGRQLEFNFTLPLAAAGFFATKWALQNEQAMIQVKKVYGDLSFSQQRINEETDALATSFDLLSTRFGVNKKEVIDVAAAWASAGSAGRGLAENTRATLEAMIIGDMDATAATEALIAIMATYRISSKKNADGTSELGDALADLNIIENQTGIRFSGLVDVLQRAGGSAAQAGVDIRHLAAFAAALVPATGSAAQAGNALRTMISRLQAPTRDTIDVLEKMGISVMSKEWLGKTATEKIETMAESFINLSSANQTLGSSVVASRWQVNRFARLMEDIGSKTGYYQKALDATSEEAKHNGDITKQQAAYWRELGVVLDSNPKKFDILANSLKNNLTSAVIPLMPAIMGVVASIAKMGEQFADLDPKTQKWIVFGLAFLAITGPIVRLTGAWILLLSQVGKMLFHAGQGLFWFGKQAIIALGWIWTSFANLIIGEGKVAAAFIRGEAQKAAAVTSSNATITASNAAMTSDAIAAYWSQAVQADMVYSQMALSAGAAYSAIGTGATAMAFTVGTALMAGFQPFGALMASMVYAAEASFAAIGTAFVVTMEGIAIAVQGAGASFATAFIMPTQILGALNAAMVETVVVAEAAMAQIGTSWVVTMEGMVIAAQGAGGAVVEIWAATWEGTVAIFGAGSSAATGVYVTFLAELEATTLAAATGIASIWVASTTGVIGATSVSAGAQWAIPAAALPAAEATAAIWAAEAAAVASIQTAAMGEIAAAQSLPALGAAAGASRTTGIFRTMFGSIGMMVARFGTFIMTALEGAVAAIAVTLGLPFWAVVAIIVAVAAAIVAVLKTDIEDPVIRVVQSIARWIAELPGVFNSALSAVARVVAGWITAIVDMLSYLNPFARHSPSLVDNVRAGVATILDEYSKLRGIGRTVLAAAQAHDAFNKAIASTQAGFDATERGQQRQDIAKVAPQALPAFDAMGPQIDALKQALVPLAAEINAQKLITAAWQAIVDRLSDSLERETRVLDALKAQLDDIDTAMQKANDTIQDLGNMDLPGMRAMEDQIFANEQAQKALRLELLKMEEAGQSIEDVKQKMADLNGLIEVLQSEREDLRMAGAGSDVLATYDAEIAALQEQQDVLQDQGDAIQEITDKLEELQRQGEMLDLEKSLSFDGPLRQIDQMIEGLNEMPFDEIVAGIKEQQDILAELQPQHDAITAAIEKQQAIVDNIQAAYDLANDSLKEEQETLDALEQAYSDIEAQINAMESSMSGFAAAAKQALDDAAAAGSTAEQLFDAGTGADFETPIGGDILGAEGTLADIEAFNADLQAELEKVMEDMGGIDIFGGIKDRFDGFMDFIKDWGRLIGPIIIGVLLGGWPIAIGAVVGILWKFGPTIWKALKGAWDWAFKKVKPYVSAIWNWLQTAWDAVWAAMSTAISFVWNSVIKPILTAIWSFIQTYLIPIFAALAAAIVWAWETVIYPAIQGAWAIIQPILQVMWTFIQDYLVPVFQLLGAIVTIVVVLIGRLIKWLWDNMGPIFTAIWNFIKDKLVPIFQWLARAVVVVFAAIWAAIKWAWDNVIKPVFNAVWGFVRDKLGPVFTWLRDSVIKPVMNAVGTAVSGAWNNVIKPIFDKIKWAIENVVAPAFTWLRDKVIKPVWDRIKSIISGTWEGIKDIIEGGINGVIKVFNLLARTVNRIGGALNIGVHVDEMPEVRLASGGIVGGRAPGLARGDVIPPAPKGGFYGTHARAIVNEGSRMHREFVIPTDPKYRNRAKALFAMLAKDLGQGGADAPAAMAMGGTLAGGVPHFALGGLPNPIAGAIDAAKVAKDFWDAINDIINKVRNISVGFMKPVGTKIKDMVVEWGKDQISKIPGVGVAGDIASGVKGGAERVGGWLNPLGAAGLIMEAGIPHMATGGTIIGHTPGGVLMRVGEGRNDEKVQVLPLHGDEGNGASEIHFHGDLVFPNVTDGSDAEDFIKNLETLAGV